MKKSLLFLLTIPVFSFAQGNVFPASGNVGIGTASPNAKLEIKNGLSLASAWDPAKSSLTLTNGGNITLLMDSNELYSSGTFHIGSASGDIIKFRTIGDTGAEDKMIIKNNGNVGIGTIAPDAKLTVNGNIHAREVKVDLNGAVAPDYVFRKEYNLRSLEEVKAYIKEKGHLPGIPSARQMEEEGVKLKEMNLKLLEKVEELTLYVIGLKEENRQQQDTIRYLMQEMKQLKK